MARTLYPATIVFGAGVVGSPLTSAAGTLVPIYTSSSLTTLANTSLTLVGSGTTAGVTVTAGSETPDFYGPDGYAGTLYAAGIGGTAVPIYPASAVLDDDLTTIAALDSTTAGALVTDGSGWIRKSYAQLKTALGLVKADVGLGNVDNTSDAAKPVSTAQASADALAAQRSANLSDLASATTARTNLGLGTAATQASTAFDAAGAASAAQAASAQKANNLSDLASTSTALANLGGVTSAQAAAAAPVQTVFGRSGAVTAASSDLTDANSLGKHKGAWTATTVYAIGDIVTISSANANGYKYGLWRCLVAHTSGSTFSGTSVGNWTLIAGDLDTTAATATYVAPAAALSGGTYNGLGQITAFTDGPFIYTNITYNSNGLVTQYDLNGTTHTVTRNASLRITAVS